MKISIIVPVGNAYTWKKCEESILVSFAGYVGSVECEILPCYDLEHKGAYLARNEGLKKSTGDWIAWVDCDDIVESEWFGEIAAAVEAHHEVDIVQFDATEIKNGRERIISYGDIGEVSGDSFAHNLLRNDKMPAWLWTRVFRRELFSGCQFEGRVKQDYRMFLQILPRVRSVWSIGEALYRYNRTGYGLSSYVQSMDYGKAGLDLETLINALPERWLHDARIGLTLTMADVARHSGKENGSRQWVRKYLHEVLKDGSLSFRLKVKSLLAAMSL